MTETTEYRTIEELTATEIAPVIRDAYATAADEAVAALATFVTEMGIDMGMVFHNQKPADLRWTNRLSDERILSYAQFAGMAAIHPGESGMVATISLRRY